MMSPFSPCNLSKGYSLNAYMTIIFVAACASLHVFHDNCSALWTSSFNKMCWPIICSWIGWWNDLRCGMSFFFKPVTGATYVYNEWMPMIVCNAG